MGIYELNYFFNDLILFFNDLILFFNDLILFYIIYEFKYKKRNSY